MGKVVKGSLIAATYFGSFLFIWYFGVRLFAVPAFILPSPESVFGSLASSPGYYSSQFLTTASEAVAGALIGFGSGMFLGTFLRFGGWIARLLHPLIIASQVFPKEALAPIFLLILGFGIESKIAISALLSFFPVTIATYRGLLETPKPYLDVVTVMGANKIQRFVLVQLPYAAPYIFASLRLCVTLSVIGAVVGEFVGSAGGLGYLIRIAMSEQAIEMVYASLLLLGLLGGSLYGIAVLIESVPFYRFTQYGLRV